MTENKSRIAWFVGLALGATALGALPAQAADESQADQQVETIVVTGSLIPQTKVETAVPVTVITAQDLADRGFATVADALQQSTFSTGSVQGAQYSGGFTQGAQTLSMFGLSPGYTKYLIDGRPMSDYPALYNGTDTITSVTGIPIELVDHIDVLPGGQSSIYGSDAIAGVVNIILKKKLDAPVVDARLGATRYGGGTDRRLSLADSFTFGRLTLLAGAQYEKTDPIWGYQRPLTDKVFAGGTSAQTALRDYLVYDPSGIYYFEDPNNCSDLSSQFGRSVREYHRNGRGDYCGTMNSGYYTIGNGVESIQTYLHGTFDLTDNTQLYGDVLLDHDITRFNVGGGGWWGTSANYGYYYDPNFDDFVNIQRVFSPEETGGFSSNMDRDTTNSYRATLGIQGSLGSLWTYDAGFTHTEYKLAELKHVLWNDAVESYFANILGPSLGLDPYYGYYQSFTPNYAALYQPISVADYRSFSGYATSYSRTFDNMIRGQLTARSLFSLPGGDAGLALVAEAGNQGWNYSPDERFLDGGIWGYTATSGGGMRSRYALTSELRLPVLSVLTATLSGRYDAYRVSGGTVDKATYTAALEFRPVESLLVRGRYGTAFKAPTLSDEYQGNSGFYVSQTDYYLCEQSGYTGANVGNCPYYGESVFGKTSGNTKLKPITAKVWDLGLVWSRGAWTASTDLMHWDLDNEVAQQSADQLLRNEMYCRDGTYDSSSALCQAVFSEVIRDSGTGQIISIYTPKVNVSKEVVTALTASLGYDFNLGRYGDLGLKGSWQRMLKHLYQQYAGDPYFDLLRDPYESTEFNSKLDGSLTWTKGKLRTTLYAVMSGKSPNYIASSYGLDTPGAAYLPRWTVANLEISYKLTPALEIAGTVDNLFNRMPPADASYPGTSDAPLNIFNYNNYGMSFYGEVSYKFGK